MRFHENVPGEVVPGEVVKGIISAAAYVPYWRLDRSQIAATFGSGGGKGQRAVASYDEDTTTMGVEAARLAMRAAGDTQPIGVAFATANPAYLDKTNATTIHAALRLDTQVAAYDFGGAVRSSMGSLIAALSSDVSLLIVSADARDGLPTSADESGGGDGAAAVVTGRTASRPSSR
jgi:3-hydroxy-3-methylglutaryl CoA synthase